jgi:uncharacterized protein YggE
VKQSWIIPAAVLGGLALGTAGFLFLVRDGGADIAAAQTTTTTPTPLPARTITVDASGSVRGKPDIATITIGVQVDKPSAQEALDTASTRAQQVIDTLKAQGVKEDDITTADLSVYPRYDEQGRTADGYTASNTVNAVLRDLSTAGAVIDATATAAGEEVRLGGISFSISDTTALASRARAQAVERAKAQAGELAKAAGVELGPVSSVATVSYDLPAPEVAGGGRAAADSAAVPIQPGTQEVTARVTMVFELR